MFIYAQINNANVVIGISQLAGQISDPLLIPIPSFNEALIGSTWDGTAFIPPTPTVITVAPPAPLVNITAPQPGQVLAYTGGVWSNITLPTTDRIVVANNYTVQATDTYIGVQHNSPITITLPTGTPNREIVIKDEKGLASRYPITIVPSAGNTIDYQPHVIINLNYVSTILFFGTDNWSII